MENKFINKLDSADYVYLKLEILRTIFNRRDAKDIIKNIFRT